MTSYNPSFGMGEIVLFTEWHPLGNTDAIGLIIDVNRSLGTYTIVTTTKMCTVDDIDIQAEALDDDSLQFAGELREAARMDKAPFEMGSDDAATIMKLLADAVNFD